MRDVLQAAVKCKIYFQNSLHMVMDDPMSLTMLLENESEKEFDTDLVSLKKIGLLENVI